MAKSYTPTEAIGTFIAIVSQGTAQAPFPAAAIVANPGVFAGLAYKVYAALKVENITWILLESTAPNKPEWVRVEEVTNSNTKRFGYYSGPVVDISAAN